MNAEAIQKLPEALKKKIRKNPTNTKFDNKSNITEKLWRIKYAYTKLPDEFTTNLSIS